MTILNLNNFNNLTFPSKNRIKNNCFISFVGTRYMPNGIIITIAITVLYEINYLSTAKTFPSQLGTTGI